MIILCFAPQMLFNNHWLHVKMHYSSLCITTQRHWIHINVCWVSCGGVFNILLILSITFYFRYNIWGCMCSSDPLQLRWLKWCIYSSCYYHHQIGSIHLSHCNHIFPWLCLIHECPLLCTNSHTRLTRISAHISRARFMYLARSKFKLCSANHMPGYWSNRSCDLPGELYALTIRKNRKWAQVTNVWRFVRFDSTWTRHLQIIQVFSL